MTLKATPDRFQEDIDDSLWWWQLRRLEQERAEPLTEGERIGSVSSQPAANEQSK